MAIKPKHPILWTLERTKVLVMLFAAFLPIGCKCTKWIIVGNLRFYREHLFEGERD